MEARLVEVEEQLKKMNKVMESLQQENKSLKWKHPAYNEGAGPNHNKQPKGEVQSASGMNVEEAEKKLHDELHSLVKKYEEMARRMGRYPQLTNCFTAQTYLITWR